MNPIEFYGTIYLGDRWCKRILFDGVAREIKLEIDLISRVRGCQWDHYADEDIPSGFIVLEDVESFEFSPQGPLPNDWIEFISVTESDQNGNFRFEFSLGSCSPDATATDVRFTVIAKQLCLSDADGHKIRT